MKQAIRMQVRVLDLSIARQIKLVSAMTENGRGGPALGSKHSCHVLLMTEAANERDVSNRHTVVA